MKKLLLICSDQIEIINKNNYCKKSLFLYKLQKIVRIRIAWAELKKKKSTFMFHTTWAENSQYPLSPFN